MLPAASVAVTVTVLAPRLEHPNVEGDNVNEVIAQLSTALETTWAVLTVPEPFASSATVTGPATNVSVGAVTSAIVTVMLDVLTFPEPSTAVTVTVFVPVFAHVNTVLL